MKYCIFLCLTLCVYLLGNSCAKQSIPNGGPKDSIPPTLVKSIPIKRQLNYKKKTIEMTFSEDIILNNPKEQVIITPSVNKEFQVTAQKKTVKIEFEKNLLDSTTYTINMRDAVQDITEKNSAKNLQIAFSTGPYIDSTSIDGKVYDILKNTPIKDGTIGLFRYSDTLVIFKHKPAYLTKTDDNGIYKIENLKVGKYFAYAFDDKNKNLIVDSKNEAYGFINLPIELDSNISKLDIPIQKLDARPLKLTSARPYNNYYNIKTSKSLLSFDVSNDTSKFISCYGEDKSIVKIYNTIGKLDSIKAIFRATDSIGNKIDTILYVKFNNKKSEPEKFAWQINDPKIYATTGLLQTTIAFNKPIATVKFDSLLYRPDSISTFNITEKEMQWDFSTNLLTIKKFIDPKYFIKVETQANLVPNPGKNSKPSQKEIIQNQLIFGSSTFISIDADSSKRLTQTPTILREEETGTLLISIQTAEANFITQLLSKDFKVLETIENSKSIKFENLPPATYLIRVVIDKNANHKWDSGNFYKRQPPEPIVFYKNEKNEPSINLKANWEIGPLLITF